MADMIATIGRPPVEVHFGENTAGALAASEAAAASAALAESVSGPTYPDTIAGLAATTDGQAFAVDNGDGTVTVYLNDGGIAVAQRTLATTAALGSPAGGGMVGYGPGTVADALDGLGSLPGDLAVVAGRPAGSLVYKEPDPLSVVAAPSTINLADPGQTDPLLADTAAQILRLWNNNAGSPLSAQGPSLGTFMVLRRYEVTAGKQYTISMARAGLGWLFYFTGSPFISFFNTDGSWHSAITTGFTRGAGDRSVTFTVPAGAERVAFNVRNPADFSNDNNLTVAAADMLIGAIMLNEGPTALPYTAWSNGAYVISADRFDVPEISKPILVEKQGLLTYVRHPAQMSPTKDLVRRLYQRGTSNYAATNSRSGVLDFVGQRFVPKTASDAIAAFNQSTQVFSGGGDESAATKMRGMYVNGQHGSTAFEVPVASHDKTAVDVGGIVNDGVDNWVLLKALSATKLLLQRRYTGSDTDWVISSDPPASNTFTHVSGMTHTATITGTASAQAQWVPIIREYTTQMEADGVAITADGAYPCEHFIVHEALKGLNLAKVQDSLVANVGAADPDYTPDVAMCILYYRHEFDEFGGYSCPFAYRMVDGHTRLDVDHIPGIQLQRPSLTGDSTPGMSTRVDMLIPDVGTVGGLNFKAGANLTANAADIVIAASDCDDPNDPSSLFSWLAYSGSANVAGELFGYDPTVGLGIPVNRAASVAIVINISPAEKSYPRLIDIQAGPAVDGETEEAVPFRAAWPADIDSHLKVPGVCIRSKGKVLCFIITDETLTGHEVSVPVALSGLPVTVLKATNATVRGGYVSNGKIKIDTTGASGAPAVLKLQIGPTP